MHDALSDLLTDLKNAIHHSLADDTVKTAMAALEKAGHVVNVALDIAIISEGNEEHAQATQSFKSAPEPDLDFSPSDVLFLHVLGITV
jgi:hypothetical protein